MAAPAATVAPLTEALFRSVTRPATEAVTPVGGGGVMSSTFVFLQAKKIIIKLRIIEMVFFE